MNIVIAMSHQIGDDVESGDLQVVVVVVVVGTKPTTSDDRQRYVKGENSGIDLRLRLGVM